jgi:KipI family sensor histidine kinase inhibitor
MNEPRLTRAGDAAVFVELGAVSLDELRAAAAAVRRVAFSRGWIVGFSSLLGTFETTATTYEDIAFAVRGALRHLDQAPPDGKTAPPRTHSIAVSFSDADAPDLPLLLEQAKLTRNEFLEALGGLSLRARFLGFLRGFAYLEGIPASWQLPRRSTSRASVPAGSFAIAGAMAGFYPADSPGGWNLIGRTVMPLWDSRRDRPNIIAAGDEIRIRATVPVPERSTGHAGGPAVSSASWPSTSLAAFATVRGTGPLTLVVAAKDESRCEWGLPPGGPFDAEGAKAANLAVGNPENAPLLECAMVGPTLEVHDGAVFSWFGAEVSIRVGTRPVGEPRLFEAKAGEIVEVGRLRDGLRGLLAMRGGVADPAERFAVAPHALTKGEVIRRGSAQSAEKGRLRALARDDRRLLRALAGPHPAEASLIEWIETKHWTVSPSIDRTGLRLYGDGRYPLIPADLPSCGMQCGTVQCHPNGDLVVMGPDHPVTGGYLQPITVVSGDLWKLGQLMPGDEVRWRVLK